MEDYFVFISSLKSLNLSRKQMPLIIFLKESWCMERQDNLACNQICKPESTPPLASRAVIRRTLRRSERERDRAGSDL